MASAASSGLCDRTFSRVHLHAISPEPPNGSYKELQKARAPQGCSVRLPALCIGSSCEALSCLVRTLQEIRMPQQVNPRTWYRKAVAANAGALEERLRVVKLRWEQACPPLPSAL